MPIRQYDAPLAQVRSFTPNNGAAEAIAQGGRAAASAATNNANRIESAVGSVARSIDDVGKLVDEHYGRRQALDAGAEGIALFNSLNDQWNARRNTADPTDPTVADKFNEEVLKPALESFSNKYQATSAGAATADRFTQNMMSHFGNVQVADMSVMAQQAAEKDITDISNQSAALLFRDPTALAALNTHVEDTISIYKKSNPNLTAQQSAHLDDLVTTVKRTNTIAAVHGMAETNPAAAEQALKDGFGADHLTESDRAQGIAYAKEQQRMLNQQTRADEAEQRRQEQQAAYKQADGIMAETIQNDGSIAIGQDYFTKVRDLARLPGVAPGLAHSMIDYGKRITDEAEQKEKVGTDDPYTYAYFRQKMLVPPGTPNALSAEEVYKARAEGKLSDHGMTFFASALNTMSDPAKRIAYQQFDKAVEGFRSSITQSNPLLGKFVPQQDQQWGKFQSEMYARFEQAYKDGTWRKLVDERSDEYIGKESTLKPYTYGGKEGLNTMRDNLRSGVGPAKPVTEPASQRNPGEKMEDYLRRTGAK